MKKKLPELLNNFLGEIRILVETSYIYEYKVKNKYIIFIWYDPKSELWF